MKILLLTPQLPYPPHQGTTIRNYHILKHLAQKHAVTLLSFGAPAELANAAPLRDLCARIEIAPYPARPFRARVLSTLFSPLPDMALRLKSREMHRKVESLCQEEKFDVVQIEGIEMSRYMPQSQIGNPKSKIVFDDHNAEYALQRSAFLADAAHFSRWHAALYSLIQAQKLARYERKICSSADQIIACSESDANALYDLFKSEIHVIPNGVDTDYYVPSDAVCAKPLSEFALVFTGKMDYRPNIDAIVWFCRAILPRVRAEIPRAHIVIVGQKPAPGILALRDLPGVAVTGAVPDTRPFIADAAVYVMPLRMGSGTRLKALEAMAMGKAIVSTTRGVEGIRVTPTRQVICADDAEPFAREIIALLRDPARRRALGIAARELAAEMYDWRKILPAFDQL